MNSEGILMIKLCRRFFDIDKDVYVCFVYIPPHTSPYYKISDEGFFEVIDKGVQKYSQLGNISRIGDLNTRCGQKNDYFQEHEDMFKHADFYNSDFYDMTDFPKRFSMDKTVNQSGNRLIDLCAACDLRIVNGRIGDDAGVGACMFLSHSGTSLIDYAICSVDMFCLIKNFVVHDFQSVTSHAPIELNLKKPIRVY